MFATGQRYDATSLSAAVSGKGRAQTQSDERDVTGADVTRRILVVDDEVWSALDMEWVVQKLGHEVVGPAATVEAAISLAEEVRPDLVLMDIRLAYKGDGIAAATEIRRRFDIASIFVSALGDSVTRARASVAHPSGFIEKPFSPEGLAQAIKTALNTEH